MNKEEILRTNYLARTDEVLGYQINIDNYRLAIAEVARLGDPDLEDFRQQLEDLLVSSIREQKKARIMLEVIGMQLEG